MPNALVAPVPVSRFYDNNGNPLAGGQVFTYSAGTTTPAATYTDSTASQQNANPLTLNSRGEANIWWAAGVGIKLVVTDSSGNQISSTDQLYTGTQIQSSGSFTATGIGFVGSPTATIYWSIVGNEVTVVIAGFTAQSNSTSFTLTGIPAAIQPPTLSQIAPIPGAVDNSAGVMAAIGIPALSSTWTLYKNIQATGWTASGNKGFTTANNVFSYLLQ